MSGDFTPFEDPFPEPDVFKNGEATIDDKFRAISDKLFGKKSEEEMKTLVGQFKEAVKKEGLTVTDNDHFHRKMLRAGELDVDFSVKILKDYLKQLNGTPIDYKTILPLSGMDKIFQQDLEICMPVRDQHGRRVIVMTVGKWNPDKVSLHDLLLELYTMLELLSLEPRTQIAGVTVIFEGDGFGFKQFRNTTPTGMLNIVNMVQDRIPVIVRGIHLINTPKLFNAVFNTMVKPFLNEKMRERVFTHGKVEELHQHVSPAALPKSLGGDIEKLDNSKCLQSLLKFEGYYKEVRKMAEDNKDKLN